MGQVSEAVCLTNDVAAHVYIILFTMKRVRFMMRNMVVATNLKDVMIMNYMIGLLSC
ncbi:MAG: hypothetical protein Pg6A_19720 [Termitinemataceae bacterium]|nr:MAG: hypothetical protein Pg6A_19720 [Termitinemataceae bacterium]